MFGGKAHTGTATLWWLLATAGFILILAGTSVVQQQCGKAGANQITTLGSSSYLAPVTCDRYFSFDWFIVWFHFFVWLLVAFFLFSRKVHLARAGLTALLGIAAVLLMFQSNTWYRPWGGLGPNFTSKFIKGAKVLFAGAVTAAIADLLLLMTLGLHDEKTPYDERVGGRKQEVCPPGYVPATTTTAVPTTTTTTTTAQPRGTTTLASEV